MKSVLTKFLGAATLGVSLFAIAAPATAADAESCKAVRFADVGWTDIQVITGIAANLFDALGYASEVKTLSVPVTYASLKNNVAANVALNASGLPGIGADADPRGFGVGLRHTRPAFCQRNGLRRESAQAKRQIVFGGNDGPL